MWWDRNCPANATMDYYFEKTGSKLYRSLPIVITHHSNAHWRRYRHSQSKFFKALLIYNVFASSLKIEFSGDILLVIFTRLLERKNDTCVPSNQSRHKAAREGCLSELRCYKYSKKMPFTDEDKIIIKHYIIDKGVRR